MATQLSVRPQWESPYERSFQLRKTLEDSRKAFLNFTEDKEINSKDEKRAPAKKISFKIKKTSSLYRRKEKISVNTVQELAKKYNDLVEKSEQPNKMRIVVKKEIVMRKPSLKKRPSDTLIIRKSSVKRDVSRKFISNKEISKLEMEGGVKAAIAIFEERIKSPQPAPKPKVPEKTFNAKDIASRNHEKRLRIYEKRLRSCNNNNHEKEKTDVSGGEFFVQVVNIPLSPPKKCDSKYETMHLRKTTNLFTKDTKNSSQEKSRLKDIRERLEGEQTNNSKYSLKEVQENREDRQSNNSHDRLKEVQVRRKNNAEDRLKEVQENLEDRLKESDSKDQRSVVKKKLQRSPNLDEDSFKDRLGQISSYEDREKRNIRINLTENVIDQKPEKWSEDLTTSRNLNVSQQLKTPRNPKDLENSNEDLRILKNQDNSNEDLRNSKNQDISNEDLRISKNQDNSDEDLRTSTFSRDLINNNSSENLRNSRDKKTEGLKTSEALKTSINAVRISKDSKFEETADTSSEVSNMMHYQDKNMLLQETNECVENSRLSQDTRRPENSSSDSFDEVSNSSSLEPEIYEDSKLKIYEDEKVSNTSKKTCSKSDLLRSKRSSGKSENPKDPRRLIARIIGKRRGEKKSENSDKRKLSDTRFYDLENSDASNSSNKDGLSDSSRGNGEISEFRHDNKEISDLSHKNRESSDSNQKKRESTDLSMQYNDSDLSPKNRESSDLNQKKRDTIDLNQKTRESIDLSITKYYSKDLCNKFIESSDQKNRETTDLNRKNNEASKKNRESSDLSQNNSESSVLSQINRESSDLSQNNRVSQNNGESSDLCQSNNDIQNEKDIKSSEVISSNVRTNVNPDGHKNIEPQHLKDLDCSKNNSNEEFLENSTKPKDLIYTRCPVKTKDSHLKSSHTDNIVLRKGSQENSKLEFTKKFEGLPRGSKKVNIASTIQDRVKKLELVNMTKNTYLKTKEDTLKLKQNKTVQAVNNSMTFNREEVGRYFKIKDELENKKIGNKSFKQSIEINKQNPEIADDKKYGQLHYKQTNGDLEAKVNKNIKVLNPEIDEDTKRIYKEILNENLERKNAKEKAYKTQTSQENEGTVTLKQNLIRNKAIEELEGLMLRKINLKTASNEDVNKHKNNSSEESSIYETLSDCKEINTQYSDLDCKKSMLIKESGDYEKSTLIKMSADYEKSTLIKKSHYEKCVVYEKSTRVETLDDYEECTDIYDKCRKPDDYKKYPKIYEITGCVNHEKSSSLQKSGDHEKCTENQTDWEDLYDFVDVNIKPSPSTPTDEQPPSVPPRRIKEEKIYEELIHATHDYEDDGYEICESPSIFFSEENIYETLPTPKNLPSPQTQQPPLLPRRKEEPLPPRPPSRNSYTTHENESNFYESIYSKKEEDAESTYESIYGCRIELDQWKSKRDSLISEQQSNSIYNRSITSWAEGVSDYMGKNGSEISGSDRSDEWVDMSDNDEGVKNSGFIIFKERQKVGKRVSGWSQQMRDQWNKIPRNANLDHGDSDSDHHYETLSALNNPITTDIQDDEFDSFDSDSESDNSFAKNDSGVDMGNTQLPETPNQQTYVHRLAATAGKHMKKWRNWSLTKNDITKTLGRMTKRKSRTDLDGIDKILEEKSPALSLPPEYDPSLDYQEAKPREPPTNAYQNVQFTSQENQTESNDKTKSLGRKGFLNKFRRSMSISGDTPELSLNNGDSKAKSTFYLTETIDVDKREDEEKEKESEVPVVNLSIRNKTSPTRPRVPPPPAPKQNSPNLDIRKKSNTKRSTSWYSECGVFKNAEPPPILPRRPNTFWYAEVGLYRSTNSTPSTSSTENSGSLTNVIIKPIQEDNDDYYNVKNENDYYNGSIQSSDSYDTKKDEAFNSLPGDLQLRLQDEPLYQFYDAAVLESVCKDGTSDFEYDGYEEVGKKNAEVRMSTRPSAMELVAPKRNNVSVARTLWCEIPEVIQSTVLSTLSLHQKKLQEAKFEMLTSEASYLNSLNVLADHFVKTFETSDFLNQDEKDILFGKVNPVKECSEKLLMELEKCWQDNILLHGICDIVKKHAEENFYVYVSYCENQILLDRTLRKIKERPGFIETLKQLESSTVCHLLTLHSFLMLPMQRVTRWPLLLDAVLKRLSHQDEEYLSCQYALATLNKIVNQCNEGARRMERVTEMQKLASQLEFGKGVTPISLVTGSRWLIRSGPLIQMQARGDDIKLTFGKRFSKVPLHLFLFNDILIVAKSRGDENYIIQHYCYRSYLEINSETLSCLPLKDTQGRHLIFLTILENHEEKTIELLLSCNSETDKERWLEALSPPKSENPDETLYECWDCPQVTAIHTYTANQPDELALSRGDIINVTRKMADGWYHGERIRDGETGWFPANYTVEVANPHVRARNLKQRYRLLAFSESYLKSK